MTAKCPACGLTYSAEAGHRCPQYNAITAEQITAWEDLEAAVWEWADVHIVTAEESEAEDRVIAALARCHELRSGEK